MKTKTLKTISIISIVTVLGYGSYSFLFPKDSESELSINISSSNLERGTLAKSISASGTIASTKSISINSVLISPVKEVYKQVGDVVSKGDVLAQVDTSDLQTDINRALKTYNDAKYLYDDRLADAYETLEDAKRAYAGGYPEGSAEWTYVYNDAINWDAATQAAQSAYDNIFYNDTTSVAKNSLDTLLESRTDAKLISPMDGVVTLANVSVGNTTTGILYVIQDPTSFKVESSIAAYDINLIYVNQKVNVQASDLNQDYVGTITQVSPISNANGDYDIEVTLEGDLSLLRIGMDTTIEIVIDQKENVFFVPLSSVVSENQEVYLLSYDNQTQISTRHDIQLGLQNDYYVEVTGDSLIEGLAILNDPLNSISYTDPNVTPGGPFGGN